MELKGKKIGVALTGSFCTFEKAFQELQKLADLGAELHPILSNASQTIHCRFGNPQMYLERLEAITGRKPILCIEGAEPIGPTGYLDILVILPCTGNTAAKLANGITDTPVCMAAKAHLRSDRPLLITLASNDALSANLRNIGTLLSRKSVYFTPMVQDDPTAKPHSLVAEFSLVPAALEAALEGRQLRPIFLK